MTSIPHSFRNPDSYSFRNTCCPAPQPLHSVLVGDGTQDGKALLHHSHLYGCNIPHGGPAHYFAIDHSTMDLSHRESRSYVHWAVEAVTFNAQVQRSQGGDPIGPCARISAEHRNHHQDLNMKMRECVLKWCRLHPGWAVVLTNLEGRPEIPGLHKFRVSCPRKMIGQEHTRTCAAGSMVNVAQLLQGKKVVERVLCFFKNYNPQVRDLRDWVRVLNKVNVGCIVTEQRRKREWRRFEQGLWVLRLTSEGFIDYLVVVDCKNRVMYDSKSYWPMMWSSALMRSYGIGMKLKVTEARRIEAVDMRFEPAIDFGVGNMISTETESIDCEAIEEV